MSYQDPERGGGRGSRGPGRGAPSRAAPSRPSGGKPEKDEDEEATSVPNTSSRAPDRNPLGERTGQNLSHSSTGNLQHSSTGNLSIDKSGKRNMEPPGEEEREYYFHGLAGGQLVARTSAAGAPPWSLPIRGTGYDPRSSGLELFSKFYAAFGANQSDSPLFVRQVRAVLPRILEELETLGIDWTWFTAVRIGLEKFRPHEWDEEFDLDERAPLVMLIHVRPGSTDFDVGSHVVWAVKYILERRNLSKIQVEMREGQVFEQSMPEELELAVDRRHFAGDSSWPYQRVNVDVLPLLSSLGWTVERTDMAAKVAGTVGLYILHGDKVCGITCCHVVMPDWKTTAQRIMVKDAKPEIAVSQASADVYQGVLGRLREKQTGYENKLKSLLDVSSKPTDKEQRKMNKTKDLKQYIDRLLEIVKSVSDDFKSTSPTSNIKGSGLKKRRIGQILATPEYSVSASDSPDFRGFWNDWALLSFDPKLMKDAANECYISQLDMMTLRDPTPTYGKASAEAVSSPARSMSTASSPNEEYDEHRARQCFVKIQSAPSKVGRVTDGNHGGLGAVRVFKRGMHGLTLGVTNGVEACIRRKKSGETEISGHGSTPKMPLGTAAHSWELMVIPFTKYDAFSKPGDSGSSVIEENGRAVGILVGASSGKDAEKPRPEPEWRGYKNPAEILEMREPRGFDKGKGPSESKLPPHGPEAVGTEINQDPYPKVVSFVTPLEFILEDIKRVTGKEARILSS